MEPVESTQKHTSIKPKAGICKSLDLDLFSWATLSALLGRLTDDTKVVVAGGWRGISVGSAGTTGTAEDFADFVAVRLMGFIGFLVVFADFLISLFLSWVVLDPLLYCFLGFVLNPSACTLTIYLIVLVALTNLLLLIRDACSTYSLPYSIVL
jgi:hypothetical protein